MKKFQVRILSQILKNMDLKEKMNYLNFGLSHIFQILYVKSLYFRNQERELTFRKKGDVERKMKDWSLIDQYFRTVPIPWEHRKILVHLNPK